MFTSYHVDAIGDFLYTTGYANVCLNSNTAIASYPGTTAPSSTYYYDNLFDPSNINPFGFDLLKIQLPKYKEEDYPKYPKCRHSILDNGTNVLCFATTGFSRKELDVRIEDTTLIIKGCKEKLTDTEGNTKPEREVYNSISQKNFEVAFKLSDKFDLAKVKPSYEDGLLTIKIPLSEEVQKRNKSLDIE